MMSRPWNCIVAVAVAVAAVSCGPDKTASNGPDPARPANGPSLTPADPGRPAAPAGASAADAAAAAAAAPVMPADARYTLYVADFTGPNHLIQANRIKATLVARTRMKDWYVMHAGDHSALYYGFYREFEPSANAAEGARAQADRRAIAAIVNPDSETREPMFTMVHFVPLDAPDPNAPKEWDLVNAKGYWSLQVATFKDSPDRKQAAVEAVREFRTRGIEAYYHHNEVVSCVFLGAWPREAVKEQDSRDDAHSEDPTQPLLVLAQPLPKGVNPDLTLPDGTRAKAVAPRIEVVDPDMKRMLEEYPNNYINGEVYGSKTRNLDGTVRVVPDPSLIVIIPHDDSQPAATMGPDPSDGVNGKATTDKMGLAPMLDNPRTNAPASAEQQQQQQQQQPAAPAKGTLRSLGE